MSGLRVVPPSELKDLALDKIIICNIGSVNEIKDSLINQYGFSESEIDIASQEILNYLRKQTITDIAKLAEIENMPGSVAECGVWYGQFAEHINRSFPDRAIWLFDTFEGFDESDMSKEVERGIAGGEGHIFTERFKDTSVDKVRARLPFAERAIFKKGYFPDTTIGDERLKTEQFVFVQIDFDLYQPTLSGLDYFYSKMVHGGIILVHDFFSYHFIGVAQAVREFCGKRNIRYIPIGDGFTIAIIKQ